MNVTASQTLPATTANSTYVKVYIVTMASKFATTTNATVSVIWVIRGNTAKSTTVQARFAQNMGPVNLTSLTPPAALAKVAGLAVTAKFLIHVSRTGA